MSVIVPPTPVFPANSYNYAPQNLKKWRAALARVRSGSGNARVLCIGDSTTYGYGSNGTGTGNLKPLCYPTQLAGLFNAVGINAHWNSFMADQSGTGNANNGQNDSRITMGSAWSAYNASYPSVGGQLFTATAGTNALSFLPTVNVDTFIIYYVQGNAGGSSFGKFQWDINGGSATVIDTDTGTNGIVSTTATGTLGSNTLNIKWNANGPVFILGVEAYDSSKKWVSVVNAGWPGTQTSNWNSTSTAFSPLNTIPALNADLTIINLTINDWNAGVTASTYKTNMQAIITQALTTGDVVLASGNPSDPGSYASIATQNGIVAAMYQVAAANNLVVIDNYTRWVGYTSSNGLGLNYDGRHPNGLGYADLARGIMNVIGSP